MAPRQKPKPADQNSHLVLANISRTEDAIRSNIVYSTCNVLRTFGAACDLRMKPVDYGLTLQRWATEGQNILADVRRTYPSAKASNTETKAFHTKPLEQFCDLIFKKITA
jgi:hypothetical protein